MIVPRLPLILALLALLVAGCVPRVLLEPYPVYEVELPRDDAAHDAPIEWWYWVGHLESERGRRYAFQLTFFEAYVPPEARAVVPFAWLLEQGRVVHVAVVDLDTGEHVMRERFDGL
jgi:predicted secreted hydrolase